MIGYRFEPERKKTRTLLHTGKRQGSFFERNKHILIPAGIAAGSAAALGLAAYGYRRYNRQKFDVEDNYDLSEYNVLDLEPTPKRDIDDLGPMSPASHKKPKFSATFSSSSTSEDIQVIENEPNQNIEVPPHDPFENISPSPQRIDIVGTDVFVPNPQVPLHSPSPVRSQYGTPIGYASEEEYPEEEEYDMPEEGGYDMPEEGEYDVQLPVIQPQVEEEQHIPYGDPKILNTETKFTEVYAPNQIGRANQLDNYALDYWKFKHNLSNERPKISKHKSPNPGEYPKQWLTPNGPIQQKTGMSTKARLEKLVDQPGYAKEVIYSKYYTPEGERRTRKEDASMDNYVPLIVRATTPVKGSIHATKPEIDTEIPNLKRTLI